METKPRRSYRRKNTDTTRMYPEDNGVIESPIRNPDRVITNDRVFYEEHMMADDRELMAAIQQSRDEFIQQERIKKEAEEALKQLKTDLAIPISRLRLWKQHCNDDREQNMLSICLQLIECRLQPECKYPKLTKKVKKEIDSFLEQLNMSKLYRQIVEVIRDIIINRV